MKKSAVVLTVLLCCFLLFLGVGGCGGTAPPSTTTAEAVHWTCLQPTGKAPSGRLGHVMAYDPGLGKMILFGGWDGSGTVQFNDTWAYDPSAKTWTELNPAGDVPSVRGMLGAAYDPSDGTVLIFGGCGGESQAMNDLWAYDPAANTWTQLEAGSDIPSLRRDHAMVYVPSLGQVILFGGCEGLTSYDDTWAYDPAANIWTELHPAGDVPCARVCHTMVYDPGSGKVILFGGGDEANTAMNDLWAYDPAENVWAELHPAGDVPCARLGQAMVYNPASGKVILFGGMDQAMNNLNDLWAYDPAANTWTELQPVGDVPPARDSHAIACDPASGKVILFGGENGCAVLDDTWVLAP